MNFKQKSYNTNIYSQKFDNMKQMSFICVSNENKLMSKSQIMEIQVFQSKKGTKVVTTSNLYEALQLPAHLYNGTVKYWVQDIYDFSDDVRKPQLLKDYSEIKQSISKRKDYYISLVLARLITLNSNSPVKLVFARKLTELVKPKRAQETFSKDQILAVLELTKVMGLISCQKSAELGHQHAKAADLGKSREWWNYRARLLGYNVTTLKAKMSEIGASYKGKNLRQMLIKTDKYEMIRMAVIDLFLALGNSEHYAKDMGDLAKIFANELKVEIRDDRKDAMNLYPKNANRELVKQVRQMAKQQFLPLW